MMYNRYIPDAAGVYHPTRVGAEPQTAARPLRLRSLCLRAACSPASAAPCPPCTAGHGGFLSRLLPRSIDTGDRHAPSCQASGRGWRVREIRCPFC